MCLKEHILNLALTKVAEKNSLRKIQENAQNLAYDHYGQLNGERLPSLRYGLLQVAVTKPVFPYVRIDLRRTIDNQTIVYQINIITWKDYTFVSSTDNQPEKIPHSCSSWAKTKEYVDNIIAEYLAK